jgi:tetratricopeptide (TPR) repeat protein
MLLMQGKAKESLDSLREVIELGTAAPKAVLALAVANRGNALGALERHEEATEAYREAVALYRELSEEQEETFRSQLAICMYNLGNEFATLGRTSEAVHWHREAAETLLSLFRQHPDGFRDWMQQMLFDYLESAREAGVEVSPELQACWETFGRESR